MTGSTNLSNLQIELLKIYSKDISERELLDIKKLLAEYFSRKLTNETERIWDEKGLTDEVMDAWLKELS